MAYCVLFDLLIILICVQSELTVIALTSNVPEESAL